MKVTMKVFIALPEGYKSRGHTVFFRLMLPETVPSLLRRAQIHLSARNLPARRANERSACLADLAVGLRGEVVWLTFLRGQSRTQSRNSGRRNSIIINQRGTRAETDVVIRVVNELRRESFVVLALSASLTAACAGVKQPRVDDYTPENGESSTLRPVQKDQYAFQTKVILPTAVVIYQ